MKIRPHLLYHYMICYNFSNGSGRIELIRDKRIKSYEDIQSIDEVIKDLYGFNAHVYNYKLLKTEFKIKEKKQCG